MTDLARYRVDTKRGGYFIDARYNERGLWKTIEHLPTEEMAKLFVVQMTADDRERRVALREVRDWDFIDNAPAKPKRQRQREAKEKREKPAPVRFSFLD